MQHFIFSSLILISRLGFASPCVNFTKAPAQSPKDPLYQLLHMHPECARDTASFKLHLKSLQIHTTTAMVANRGRQNPSHGSFSIFESAFGQNKWLKIKKGQLFFGYFTKKFGSTVHLDTRPEKGKLLIEAISWDSAKKMFNFYELIGEGQTSGWHYRGDSYDAIQDNRNLHRATGGEKFGKRMRCSACHNSGTPIFKEMAAPHNDWWRKSRPLSLGGSKPAANLAEIMVKLDDASAFVKDVKVAHRAFMGSKTYSQIETTQSLQEILRPLFCTVEINITSAQTSANSEWIQLAGSLFLNPLLLKNKAVLVRHSEYQRMISHLGFQFPEGNLRDADQPWLAPVKGYADQLKIVQMIKKGLVSLAEARSILSFDFKNPLFSAERCALLRFVPETWTANWFQSMRANLYQHQKNLSTNFELHHKGGWTQQKKDMMVFMSQIHTLTGNRLKSALLHLDYSRKSVFQKRNLPESSGTDFGAWFPCHISAYSIVQDDKLQGI